MAIGIVEDDLFDNEFNNICNQLVEPEVIEISRGRGHKEEVPESIREIVAEDVINGNSAAIVAKTYGVSESSVSAYKNGANSTSSYNTPVQSLLSKNNRVREIIGRKSKKILMRALDSITDEKLNRSKATDLSIIAKNMSGVMQDMIPKVEVNNTLNQTFVYKPRVKDEDEFEVIEVDG